MRKLYSLPIYVLILVAYTHNAYAADPQAVLFAAGDVATCENNKPGLGAKQTATLLKKLIKDNPKANVVVLGDLAYKQGTGKQFQSCYKPTWGKKAIKNVTYPVPGNHEYYSHKDKKDALNIDGYHIKPYKEFWSDRFSSFPADSGNPKEGYYKVDFSDWRIIGLNTEVIVDNAATLGVYPLRGLSSSDPKRVKIEKELKDVEARFVALKDKQNNWLRDEAFKDSKNCELVFMHHPRYSSGKHGNIETETKPLAGLYKTLYEEGVSVILSAHDHGYERFYPMNDIGEKKYETGMRSFVVGTGGAEFRPFEKIHENSEVRNNVDWGVLKLELFEDYYTWQFIPVKGKPMNKHKEFCVPRSK